MGYNVERKPIGMVPNAPLAYALEKEPHPPILSTLVIHRGQVNRERYCPIIFSIGFHFNCYYIIKFISHHS